LHAHFRALGLLLILEETLAGLELDGTHATSEFICERGMLFETGLLIVG